MLNQNVLVADVPTTEFLRINRVNPFLQMHPSLELTSQMGWQRG